jgi:predicted dinucleotide-binding enzyme
MAFIGIGNMGFSIADKLQKIGHDVFIGRNGPESESVKPALTKNSSFKLPVPALGKTESSMIINTLS